MTPELEAAFRDLAAARLTKQEQRAVRDAAQKSFDKAAADEARAITRIGRLSGVRPKQDLYYDVGGVRWHVEIEDGVVRVRQATPEK